jgi:hypothetical protein
MEGGGRQEHVFGLKQDDPVAYDERRKEQYRRSDAKKKAKKKAKKAAKTARDRDAAQVRAAREETARVRAAHTRDAAHADAMADHNAALRLKKAHERMRLELQHVETEQQALLADMLSTGLPSTSPPSESSSSESSSDSESEQPATIVQPKTQKRRKEADESERKELTYMYGREQTHNQERREQAFCRSTEEPVLNVTNREIPIAPRVNDQEYRKLMWAQLVVLVPLALCAISVMWMVSEVTQLRAAENQRQQADSDPFDLGL